MKEVRTRLLVLVLGVLFGLLLSKYVFDSDHLPPQVQVVDESLISSEPTLYRHYFVNLEGYCYKPRGWEEYRKVESSRPREAELTQEGDYLFLGYKVVFFFQSEKQTQSGTIGGRELLKEIRSPENLLTESARKELTPEWIAEFVDAPGFITEPWSNKEALNANVLDYLFSHQDLIPLSWRRLNEYGETPRIFFWGTIFSDDKDELQVSYLQWECDRWNWGYQSLNSEWDRSSVAAIAEPN